VTGKKLLKAQVGPIDLQVGVPQVLVDRVQGTTGYRLVEPGLSRAIAVLAGRSRRSDTTGDAGPPRVPERVPQPEEVDPGARRILDRIAPIDWYHSIDLGNGVSTPGFVDHRPQLNLYGLPESLEGKRCLDVATFDGFWAFEMERRGAAEVVALDIGHFSESDIPKVILPHAVELDGAQPTGEGFRTAADLLGSKVRREICNVYDLSPERLGTFDFVFVSDLLIHLRDPQLALERAFSVCGDRVVVADSFEPALQERDPHLPLARFTGGLTSETWWLPNVATLHSMMVVAGFEPVAEVARFVLNAASSGLIHKVVLHGGVPARHSWRDQVDEEAARRRGSAAVSAAGKGA